VSGEDNSGKIRRANVDLEGREPLEIVEWGIRQAGGGAIVSTNFRPYEAVILHLCVQVQPDIPVLWVDHGCNREATYRHAAELQSRLGLKLKVFRPEMSKDEWEAVHGSVDLMEAEQDLKRFSTEMKLKPFRHGMRELAPRIWVTALRKVQNPNRSGLGVVSDDPNFGSIKLSPLFHWSDSEMEGYLAEHDLPNEWDYFDPAKADEKRECGLHAGWGGEAVAKE